MTDKILKIRDHLAKTQKEWEDYFGGTKDDYYLDLIFSRSEGVGEERKENVEEILRKIKEILEVEQAELDKYWQLYKEWNKEKEEYDAENDYGGALFTLKNLLEDNKSQLTESEQNIIRLLPSIVFAISNFLNSLNNTHLIRAEELLAEFRKNDLSLAATPNLNFGKTQGRSNAERLANSFRQVIGDCKGLSKKQEKIS